MQYAATMLMIIHTDNDSYYFGYSSDDHKKSVFKVRFDFNVIHLYKFIYLTLQQALRMVNIRRDSNVINE